MTPIILLPCYIRQSKSNISVQVYAESLYALAKDAFTKVDKEDVKLQLVGIFIDGLHHDFLSIKVIEKIQKKKKKKIRL